MWSSEFFAPLLQPMSHSPQRVQVTRRLPCRLPYGGGSIGWFASGASAPRANVTASGGRIAGIPSRTDAAWNACVFGVSSYG